MNAVKGEVLRDGLRKASEAAQQAAKLARDAVSAQAEERAKKAAEQAVRAFARDNGLQTKEK